LSGEVDASTSPSAREGTSASGAAKSDRMERLESELEKLQTEFAALRQEFAEFRKQFD